MTTISNALIFGIGSQKLRVFKRGSELVFWPQQGFEAIEIAFVMRPYELIEVIKGVLEGKSIFRSISEKEFHGSFERPIDNHMDEGFYLWLRPKGSIKGFDAHLSEAEVREILDLLEALPVKLIVRTRNGSQELPYEGKALSLNEELEISGKKVVVQMVVHNAVEEVIGYRAVEKALLEEEAAQPFLFPLELEEG